MYKFSKTVKNRGFRSFGTQNKPLIDHPENIFFGLIAMKPRYTDAEKSADSGDI